MVTKNGCSNFLNSFQYQFIRIIKCCIGAFTDVIYLDKMITFWDFINISNVKVLSFFPNIRVCPNITGIVKNTIVLNTIKKFQMFSCIFVKFVLTSSVCIVVKQVIHKTKVIEIFKIALRKYLKYFTRKTSWSVFQICTYNHC